MITVVIFIGWLLIGAYNIVLTDHISKTAFLCCWFTLLLYIIAMALVQ